MDKRHSISFSFVTAEPRASLKLGDLGPTMVSEVQIFYGHIFAFHFLVSNSSLSYVTFILGKEVKMFKANIFEVPSLSNMSFNDFVNDLLY